MQYDLFMQEKKFLITPKAKYFPTENLDKTLIFEPELELEQHLNQHLIQKYLIQLIQQNQKLNAIYLH